MAGRYLFANDFHRVFTACDSGDVETVKRLLDKYILLPDSSFINQRYEGETPLFRATMRGHREIVLLLLQHQADPNLVNQQHRYGSEHDNWSPLMIASLNDDIEMAKILLDHGADVKLRRRCIYYDTDIKKVAVFSALIVAVRHGCHEMVKLLLERGADANEEIQQWSSRHLWWLDEIDIDFLSKGDVTEIQSVLMLACEKGDARLVRTLLEFGANVNFSNMIGVTALTIACRKGDTEISHLLLESDFNNEDGLSLSTEAETSIEVTPVNARMKYYEYALTAASEKGHSETAKFLLEYYGIDVKKLDDKGASALLAAVRNGHTETAKLLLEHGVDVNTLSPDGHESLLFIAVRKGHTEMVKVLLEHGADVKSLNLFFYIIEHGHIEIAKLLLKVVDNVNIVRESDGASGLIVAIQKDRTDIVELLLELGANVNIQDKNEWSALMYASQSGLTNVVKMLLSHKPNLNLQANDRSSAVYLAIIPSHTEICKMLLMHGASLKLLYSNEQSALMIACQEGPTETVKLLLDYENDVNMQDIDGWSALAIAIEKINYERVKLLLENGAYVNLRHTKLKGWSALMLAARDECTSIAKLLLEYGADVNMQDNDGWSALMLASQDGYIKTAEVLLEYQADVNQQKNDGWSALMIASYNGEIQMIKLLVKHNADVNLLEDEGWSALMIACKMHRVEAVELLLGYGADVNILNNSGWSALMIANYYIGYRKICELLLKHGAHASIENDELISSRLHVENLNSEITVSVTNSEQHFSWDQFGLSLSIPQDSLPKETQQCIIHMKISTTSKNHQLPHNMYLVSPVYSIKCRPRCQFSKPLILEIQHCAKQDNIHKVRFVRSTSADLKFSTIDPGDGKADHVYYSCFPQHCSFGFIELDKFCKFAVAQTQTERGSCQQRYRANIFYERENPRRYKIHFVILWNIDAHNEIVCKYYEKNNAVLALHQNVEFENEHICLDVPFPCPTGVTSQSNKAWRILSLNPPLISKTDVDTFSSCEGKRRIPSCQLLVKCDEKEPTDLDHAIRLKGAKGPYDAFMISISGHLVASDGTSATGGSSQSYGYLWRSPSGHPYQKSSTQMTFVVLLKELSGKVSSRWEDIGLCLGLNPDSLDIIKADHPNNSKNCFREMIKLWWRRVDPSPSWTAIIEAVDAVGHELLAKNLREKYLKQD